MTCRLGQLALDITQRARRSTDPPTSQGGADVSTPALIALAFEVRAEMTDDELVAAVGNLACISARRPAPPAATVKTCRSRMTKAGLLERTGEMRPSVLGAPMLVWRRAHQPASSSSGTSS